MKKSLLAASLALIVLLALYPVVTMPGLWAGRTPDMSTLPASATASDADDAPDAETGVKWYTIEQAQAEAKKKPRKMFIDVYTDWCGWCKRMDKTTFSHPEVAKYLNENYYPVKLNAEQAANIIFRGQVYRFNPQANTHDLAIMLLQGQMSYPTTVFLDEKLDMIQPVPGYMDAKQFDALIHYFAENRYRTQGWEDYSRAYKGTF